MLHFVFPVCHRFPDCGVTIFEPCRIDPRPLADADVPLSSIRLL